MKKSGIILLALGAMITVIIVLNITFSTRENIVDAGALQINTWQKHSLTWPPFVGVAIMIVGAVVYLLGSKRSIS
jgi:hypothetical protein